MFLSSSSLNKIGTSNLPSKVFAFQKYDVTLSPFSTDAYGIMVDGKLTTYKSNSLYGLSFAKVQKNSKVTVMYNGKSRKSMKILQNNFLKS